MTKQFLINRYFLLICADTRSVWPAMMETLTEKSSPLAQTAVKAMTVRVKKKKKNKPKKCHSHKKTRTGSKQFTDVSAVLDKLAMLKKNHRDGAVDRPILTPFLPTIFNN